MDNMKEKLSFEEALKKLEAIVQTLENGVDELDKVVNLFEEGSQLAKYCSDRLEQVENKIENLSRKIQETE
jgi:exodeoxyribonuclease VII small subunit